MNAWSGGTSCSPYAPLSHTDLTPSIANASYRWGVDTVNSLQVGDYSPVSTIRYVGLARYTLGFSIISEEIEKTEY